jgi:glutamine amidotransferase
MGHVECARKAAGIEKPIYFSACTTDGKRFWSVRYSSNNQSRTQYHSRHIHALREIHGTYETLPDGAVIVLSEPLDEMTEHWEAVPESSTVFVEDGRVTVSPFTPE